MANFFITKIFFLTTTSFILTLIWTPLLTHILYKYRLGKGIRDAKAAPIFAAMHKKKAGTPTMGGILIWVTVAALAIVILLATKIFGPDSPFSDFNFLN